MEVVPDLAAPDMPAQSHRGNHIIISAVPIAVFETPTSAQQRKAGERVSFFTIIRSGDLRPIFSQGFALGIPS